MSISEIISEGSKTALGIEFGSTRIKAVLVDEDNKVLAQGDHEWENHLDNGIWTYPVEEIWEGLQDCYKNLKKDVSDKYNVKLTKLGAIGFSGMMHGYLAFDKNDNLLVPFRTWRNTITGEAAAELSKELNFNMPQRWSISHYYQCILNKEPHVKDVAYFMTLACYVHYKMTGRKVVGVGEASGMFPIDSSTCDYDKDMLAKFNKLASAHGVTTKVEDLMPKVLVAGDDAGVLTPEGAKLLDPDGDLQAGSPLAPPEGDAGTGMVATNAVSVGTGNVSAGTSVFSMVVLEKPLSRPHEEIDMVTTPSGEAVAMVHCNNCTSDLNSWIGIFKEFADVFGLNVSMNDIYGNLYRKALTEDVDCGGVVSFNFFGGEPVVGVNEGRPMVVRKPDAKFSLANFMRSNLYGALGVLKIGNDILLKEEKVTIKSITGHGGFFKTKGVGQSVLAAALNAPITVMATAGEGGAWGMAVLANFLLRDDKSQSLQDYLDKKVFAGQESSTMDPDPEMVKGYDKWIADYKLALKGEAAAVESWR
ncbi:MAG: FGGY-family carbohydrate kinase [Lachnospiraceae bacterium]|nr:FGGY-family carbohydrate kinase [Lachnospiraceae bacterium]